MNNLAIKLNSLFAGGGIITRLAEDMNGSGDVLETIDLGSFGGGLLGMLFTWLGELLLKVIYAICTFVLNLIELVQLAVSLILGINIDLDNYVVLDQNNAFVKIITSEKVLTTFKIVLGVSIVLVIVFTIFSIIRSEYQTAINQDEELRSKGRIFARSLRALFTMGFFPLLLLVSVILVNAILAGFNDILRGGNDSTLAGQIFIASAYDANNYRNYANQGMRIPICFNFEDPITLGQESGYTTEELYDIYKTYQPTGRELYRQFAYNDFTSFKDTLVYKNNQIYNADSYKGFENFFCTPEQYYVMADFIDYAVQNNLQYYIKNMNDVDINWKYVSDAIYDKENRSLTINYKDASSINDGKSYSVTYIPKALEMTTPIQDSINTIEALLGIGQFSDITFNALKRLEDSINIVEWETDSVYFRLSEGTRSIINQFMSSLTPNVNTLRTALQEVLRNNTSDQIMLYEAARREYNNDLPYSILDFVNGVTLPVKKLTKRIWQGSTLSFITEDVAYVVQINGTLYRVEVNEDLVDDENKPLRDSFNNPYYTLVSSQEPLMMYTNQNVDPANIVDLGSIRKGSYTLDFGRWFSFSTTTTKSFVDIIEQQRTGTVRHEGADGSWVYNEYDDQLNDVIKQIGWPQKLINDLQVIYNGININQFIATDRWLEQLGDFVSGDGDNPNSSNISTSLIHPLGLIMSELFLGSIEVGDPNGNNFTDLTFGGVFDEQTLRALILSTLGENQYFQLKAEYEYFNEMFNAYMSPILDDLAYYEGFDLVVGEAESVQLFTYKAYLASMLISSSAAEWFYSTAMSMVGAVDFANDVINPATGTYYTYSQLIEKYGVKYQTTLQTILDKAKQHLEENYVFPGDSAYPEYLEALEDYIKNNDESFDGRLEIVLSSWLSSEYKQKSVRVKYQELSEAYNNLRNLSYSTSANAYAYWQNILSMVPAVDVQGLGDDEFSRAESIEILKRLQELADDMMDYTKDAQYDFNDQNLYNAVSRYYDAIVDFIDEKTEALTPDLSYSYVNKKDELKSDLLDDYSTIEDLYNSWTVYLLWNRWFGYSFQPASLRTNDKTQWEQIQVDVKKYRARLNECISSNGEYTSEFKNVINSLFSVSSEDLINKCNEMVGYLQSLLDNIDKYIEDQTTIDRLNRYYITLAVNSSGTLDNDALALKVVVNNHTYTVGRNLSTTKFLEYVLGAEFLKNLGYDVNFVDEDYKGLIEYSYRVGPNGQYLKDDNGNYILDHVMSFGTLHDFVVEIGDITATLFQMTNLPKLSEGNYDEIKIGSTLEGNETDVGHSLSRLMLDTILDGEYLPVDLVRAFFGIDSVTVADGQTEYDIVKGLAKLKYQSNSSAADQYINTILEYLLLTEEESGPADMYPHYYTNLTLKELRKQCLEFLVNYEDQTNETLEQNQKRFLTVFAIACGDWTLKSGETTGAAYNSWSMKNRAAINGYRIDTQAQAVILRLAGLENRPYEELVGAEYTVDLNRHQIDENNGDVFIICTFDSEIKQYIPFMMSTSRKANGEGLATDEENRTWLSKFKHRGAYTDYYVPFEGQEYGYFPIIAKGVVNSDGRPTCIREVDGNIEFYRENSIIHNLSNMELSSYFMSIEEVPVHFTGIGYVADYFTRLFSGGSNSLVQQYIKSNPRYAVDTAYNFCFGIDDTVSDSLVSGYVAQDFNFNTNFSQKMENLYDSKQMNMFILLVGTFSMIGALFKALWGLIGRMFDITIYFLLGPVASATIALGKDEYIDTNKKDRGVRDVNEIYSNWKQSIIGKVVSVFAYAIGFNVFLIVAPIISDIDLFADNSLFVNIPVFGRLSVGFVNAVARLVFLIAAAFLTSQAPKIFAKITETDNGFDEGAQVFENVKGAVNTVADVWSGQAAVDKFYEAKDAAADMIPGREIYKRAEYGVKSLAAKGLSIYLQAQGVPKEAAQAASEAAQKAVDNQRDAKSNKRRKAREEKRKGKK